VSLSIKEVICLLRKDNSRSLGIENFSTYHSLISDANLFSKKSKFPKKLFPSKCVKIKYSFEYHREKNKLSVYIYEYGVKKNYNTNNFYYFKSKYHVLCIKSDGKLYVINNLEDYSVVKEITIDK
jgi:hypothetical protein